MKKLDLQEHIVLNKRNVGRRFMWTTTKDKILIHEHDVRFSQ